MYGFGYAQAEDRLADVLREIRSATGRMAEAFGPGFVELDFQRRLWAHERISRDRYLELSADVRDLIEAFASGIATYMRDNPEAVPAWGFDPLPHQIVALGRHLAWEHMLRQADREYNGDPSPELGSNQWVVSRERFAEDAVILCADPHTDWGSPSRWYEAHLHGDRLHAFGFTHPGLPVFLIGHNDHLGWAAAPGGPDAADVYAIELESPSANRYRYGDGWRPIATDALHISVRFAGAEKTVKKTMQRTRHGPILHRNDTTAYAYALSCADQVRQIEQVYRQMTARDVKDFYEALDMAQTGPLRILYGDVAGNTVAIRTGRVPMRSELYSWDRPVPGNTPATEWAGVHPQDDLVQVRNPAQGWVQDCGAPPDLWTPYSPLTPDRYPTYIYNGVPGVESPRSFRARQLLSSLSRMTLQEAFDVALDTYAVGAEQWQRALVIAHAALGSDYAPSCAELGRAVELIAHWDGRADRESVGATIYARWRRFCSDRGRAINTRHIRAAQRIGEGTRRGLIEALVEAIGDMKAKDARIEVPWKEINRIRARDRSWGISGGSGPGIDVLRTITTERDLAIDFGTGGQSCTTLMVFRGPGRVESYSAVPFGQSGDPESPHSWDQAEALFSRERLKPNRYRRAGQPIARSLKLQHTLQVIE
jgi:acyl-homoserine-lactone acylase